MKFHVSSAFAMACLVASNASAMTPEACADAVYEGQKLRDGGKLLAAKEAFATCTDAACPAPIRTDCASFFEETSQRVPTVVLRVVAEDGSDNGRLVVTLDGAPITVDGRTLSLDPGSHTFSVKAPDGRVEQLTVTAAEGDKMRPVTIAFPRARPVLGPPAAVAAPTRMPAYVAFGIGAVALTAFGVLGTWGLTERSSLQECRPACATGEVDAARVKLIGADVALGTAVVAVGVGLVLWFTGKPETQSSQTARRAMFPSWKF